MNWKALGAISELIEAIGVIVMLLYLSWQINHDSKKAISKISENI